MSTESILKRSRAEMFLRVALVIMGVIALFSFVSLVSAEGSTRISGIGYFPEEGECGQVEELGADFANKMEGDLQGCLYVFVDADSIRETPGGVYIERGSEIYVGSGEEGDDGSFETTYLYTAKFTEDGQQFGRCQHPIVAGRGSGDYAGATGRIDFKDTIEDGAAVNFPYTGNLKTS